MNCGENEGVWPGYAIKRARLRRTAIERCVRIGDCMAPPDTAREKLSRLRLIAAPQSLYNNAGARSAFRVSVKNSYLDDWVALMGVGWDCRGCSVGVISSTRKTNPGTCRR